MSKGGINMKFFTKNEKLVCFIIYCFFTKNLYASSYSDNKNKSYESEFLITVEENNYINYKRSFLILDYKITENNNLKGKSKFDVYIEKTGEKFNLKNILVKLKNTGWFNLKIEDCPCYYGSKYYFYLFPYQGNDM